MIDECGKSARTILPIAIAIPTYRREQVLLDTIECLLRLDPRAGEILILDQTTDHAPKTEEKLRKWNELGQVRWLRLDEPSIPKAMTTGLLEAHHDIVLFLDDDIVPFEQLVGAHLEGHRAGPRLVAGRVLQPWDDDDSDVPWSAKQFASTEGGEIEQFMGGNFSVQRSAALELGGFDENFVRVAYQFEREFADRWRARKGRIHFCPDAAIRHLKAASGGTRTFGEHLTTLSPAHSVGAYYYLFRSRLAKRRVREILGRPFRSIMTRHHLRRPWWIPITLIAEVTGMLWALVLWVSGPRYCSATAKQKNCNA
jgi:GT2 family glycosyltransferase